MTTTTTTTTATATTCACCNCGRTLHTDSTDAIRVTRANRGGRNAYLCEPCYVERYGYTAKNNTRQGARIGGGFTYSIELETAYTSATARAELHDADYLPTRDCTVDVEYKSPIMRNLKPTSKRMVTFDNLIASGDMVIDDTCGTHFHVGHETAINAETMDYVRRFYHSLFCDLSAHLENNRAATAALFGRDFGHWAQPVNRYSYATEHENFINVQHDVTIEYRLCKYNNHAQYSLAMNFCKDATAAVIKHFINHFNDYGADAEYRRAKAQRASSALIRLFDRYAAKAMAL